MEPEKSTSASDNAKKEPPRVTGEFWRLNYHAPSLTEFGSIWDLTKGSLAFGMGDRIFPSFLRT